MTISKDRAVVDRVKSLLRAGGWDLVQGGRHVKLRHVNGFQTLVPRDPGDPRARRNFEADLRRAERCGFQFQQHG